LTEEIRTFAASLPGWLKTALKNLPELLVKTKEKGELTIDKFSNAVISAETINWLFNYSVVMMLFDLLTRYSIIHYHCCEQMNEASLQTPNCEKSGMFTLQYCIL